MLWLLLLVLVALLVQEVRFWRRVDIREWL